MHDHGNLSTYSVISVTNSQTVANNINITATNTEIRECKLENVNTYTPAVNSAHPSLTGYIVTSATNEPIGAGIARITIVYTCTYLGTPATSYTEQITVEKVPIQYNVHYTSSWASSKADVTDYYVPTASVTKTQYYDSRPSCNIANIGKLSHPGSDFPGTAANWLIMSAVREQQNSFWVINTNYQYADPAWDGDIYPTL